jgi:Protein of unknown function (DUF1573)
VGTARSEHAFSTCITRIEGLALWSALRPRVGVMLSRVAGVATKPWGAVLFASLLCSVLFAVSRAMSVRSDGLLVARDSNLTWEGSATRGARGDAVAKVRFELQNVGGRPVRVVSVKSGCGCARPVVSSELVAPGRATLVDVAAMMVPLGEKLGRIDVRTDSPVKPDVPLTVRLVGTRKPPFLYLLDGEVVFLGDYLPGMSRELGVLTVEHDRQGSAPKIRIDQPFLKATLAGVETKPFMEPGTFLRRWKYNVELKERPSPASFTGLLTAESPWEHGESLSLNIIGQLQPGLRAFPKAVTLDGTGREPSSFLVVCGSPGGVLQVETEQPSAVPLIVEEEGGAVDRKTHRFTIRLATAIAPGDPNNQTRITIKQRGSTDELVVPVGFTSQRRDSAHEGR